MDAIILNISGNWGHFRKADTNNNPLTHDFITKTALIGLIGAVNGMERKEMRNYFPVLSEDLLYGVAINKPIQKESWGFTLRSVKVNLDKSPWQFEFLKHPDFTVVLGLKNERSIKVFQDFKVNIEIERAYFNPTLGIANCPADVLFISEGKFSEQINDTFKTRGFISKSHKVIIDDDFDYRIGFDSIPTYQNNDFWNEPEKYVDVAYCAGESYLTATGLYYNLETEKEKSQWFLI